MRKPWLILRTLVAVSPMLLAAGTQAGAPGGGAAGTEIMTLDFAVTRNGDRIGTSTIRLHRSGPQTIAEIATKVQVKIAYITVYRYEQRETQHWADGRLVSLSATTDDNGTVHKVSAARQGDRLAVNANGRVREVDPAVIPASLWNAQLVRRTMALDTQDGSIIPISVVDHGKTQLVLQGRATTARHYSIRTSMPHDVWYDEDERRLLKVELRGSDGSKIQYQPG